MFRLPVPMEGGHAQSVCLPFLGSTGTADKEGRKRWGEYKTDEPNAHGGFGRTDGFSKFRNNVDLCHPKPEKTDFDSTVGHMFPRALVSYDMNDETHVETNHNRRFKQNKIFNVFPLGDPNRVDQSGNPILSLATRQGLESNTNRFYQTTRNQRIFIDHTAEIRKRVAEKIHKKRLEEMKSAIRLRAFINPTPDMWQRYREICNLDYCNIDKDNLVSDENTDMSEDQDVVNNTDCEQTDPLPCTHEEEIDQRSSYLPLIQQNNRDVKLTGYQRPFSARLLVKPLKGILRKSQNESNQFVRPWVDHKVSMDISSVIPVKRCKWPCRRVRFKDEVFDDIREPPIFTRPPTPHVKSFFPADINQEAKEFMEPEHIYYDVSVCKNIPSRLGIPFKTEACKRFHQKFADRIPDLRNYRIYPKKHFFNGHHTSVLRG